MHSFHGDLLLGGDALRGLAGMLEENTNGERNHWSGEFKTSQRATLEVGRPYLLMLNDGRAHRVSVTQIENERQDRLIRFDEPWKSSTPEC